jgi:hypothetical protein
MAKRDVAGAKLLARPVARTSIESLLSELERVGVRVALSGASLDIKAPAFGSAKSKIAELKERSLEAVGYLAGKRMPAGLPASKVFPRARLMPLSVAQEALAHVFIETEDDDLVGLAVRIEPFLLCD